jgi:hypothetical protein
MGLKAVLFLALITATGSAFSKENTLFACKVHAQGNEYRIAAEMISNQSSIVKTAKLAVSRASVTPPELMWSDKEVAVALNEKYNYASYKMGIENKIDLTIKQFVGQGDSLAIEAQGTLEGQPFKGECQVR